MNCQSIKKELSATFLPPENKYFCFTFVHSILYLYSYLYLVVISKFFVASIRGEFQAHAANIAFIEQFNDRLHIAPPQKGKSSKSSAAFVGRASNVV